MFNDPVPECAYMLLVARAMSAPPSVYTPRPLSKLLDVRTTQVPLGAAAPLTAASASTMP